MPDKEHVNVFMVDDDELLVHPFARQASQEVGLVKLPNIGGKSIKQIREGLASLDLRLDGTR